MTHYAVGNQWVGVLETAVVEIETVSGDSRVYWDPLIFGPKTRKDLVQEVELHRRVKVDPWHFAGTVPNVGIKVL